MPKESADILKAKKNFYQVAGCYDVIGCINGSHISVIAPNENNFAYVNRRKVYSISIQGICDANLIFYDIISKWPGLNHNCFVLLI